MNAKRAVGLAATKPMELADIRRNLMELDTAEATARNELSVLQRQVREMEEVATSRPGLHGELTAAIAAARGQFPPILEHIERVRRQRERLLAHVDQIHERPSTAVGSHSRPSRAICDADGYKLCPNPLTARTPAGLMEMLRRFRIWAGEPSYRQMARQSQGEASASTLCTALARDDLPSLAVVLAVVTGCGGSSEDQKNFATAWRQIRFAQEDTIPHAGPAGPQPLHSTTVKA